MLDILENLLNRAKKLRRTLRAYTPVQVARKEYRDEAKALGTVWHTEVIQKIGSKLADDVTQRYSAAFTRLIKLSGPSNQTTSYITTLDSIIKPFNDDILLPAQQGSFNAGASSEFDNFLTSITDQDENEYLAEAIACAKAGFLRAATVLGWSAAIDRIHRKLEEIGFDHFNTKSAEMTAQNVGRYKRFTKKQAVSVVVN